LLRLSSQQARALGIGGKGKKRSRNNMPASIPSLQWDAKRLPNGSWIQIPEVLPSLNIWNKWHWTVYQAKIKELSSAIGSLKLVFGLPKYELVRVEVIYFFSTRRKRDTDNYTPKLLLDALRYAEIIAEDNSQVLELPPPRFEIDREKPRTEVFVWEVG